MEEFEKDLPEMFRIDYYGRFFLGELIRNDVDENLSFSGFIQYFDNYVVCTATSKRKLLDVAEEFCFIVLSYGLHFGIEKTIKILKTNYYLN